MALSPLFEVAARLREGLLDARALAEECLTRALDPLGEGARAFLALAPDLVRAQAAVAAARFRLDPAHAGALTGLPIAVKDNFDVAGEVTTAGTSARADLPPATHDAAAVRRLRDAGAVIMGRTNMTELAYSGVGINPHYGTPTNPCDQRIARIPGGSSSGAAVAVASAMSLAALGTDTGGSCRIPAALCGLVGYKPTPGRITLTGVVPLAPSYDTIGAIAPTVRCTALLDAVLSGECVEPFVAEPLRGLRFVVPQNHVFDDADAEVLHAFDGALSLLADAGAELIKKTFPAFAMLKELTRNGGIVAAEAHSAHRLLIERHAPKMDPRVRQRLELGARQCAADYVDTLRLRADFARRFAESIERFDGILMPTVPLLAPPLEPLLINDDAFTRVNRLLLRNTMIANIAGAPALSLPCRSGSPLPVGMMLITQANTDRRMFSIAAAIEAIVHDSLNTGIGVDLPIPEPQLGETLRVSRSPTPRLVEGKPRR